MCEYDCEKSCENKFINRNVVCKHKGRKIFLEYLFEYGSDSD